jgi:prepilin-type processing-associated H-X9-DG protein
MIAPAPSLLWVFMDEDQSSIDFGSFGVSMRIPTFMVDWPGTYHNFAASIAFADGHCETHKWRERRTRNPAPPRWSTFINPPTSQTPNNHDVIWLQQRTSALYQ